MSDADAAAYVDHLVYAAHDLDDAIAEIERRIGVRATPGGSHPGRGTRNALVDLGEGAYLEIVAPDPAQPDVALPRWLGVDDDELPRLTAWAARADDVELAREAAAAHGLALGAVSQGNRRRADGALLSWRFTDPTVVVADGVIPFFIDWGTSPHPSTSAAPGARLVALRAEHPDAARVAEMMRVLELPLRVGYAPRAALIATLAGVHGEVELR